MKHKKLTTGLFVIAAIAAIALWLSSSNHTPETNIPSDVAPKQIPTIKTPDEVSVTTEDSGIPHMIDSDLYESEYGALPPSLEDTQVPFNLQIDSHGNLIVSEDLRRFFDYFFTTDGEEPAETMLARVEELLVKYLPETAQQRAIDILHQYYDLKIAEIDLSKQIDSDYKASGEQPSLAEMKRMLRDLRATNLDQETYQAFFGTENQRDDYTLYRIEIENDASLSAGEKQDALRAIEQYLPPSDQEHLAVERQIQQVYSEVEEARTDGASDADIFYLREQAFGAEAAERYAEADKQKASWDNRISVYRQQRSEILNTDGLTAADKEVEIEALRQQHFEGDELKRIPVIDKMKDAGN